jgi:hypothetical protein
MANNVWQGASGASWNVASNWSLGIVGGNNGKVVEIDGGANINANGLSLTVGDIVFGGTGTVTLTGTFSLSISDGFIIDTGVTLIVPAGTNLPLSTDIIVSGTGMATIVNAHITSNNAIVAGAGQTLVLSNVTASVGNDGAGTGTIVLNGSSLTTANAAPTETIVFDSVASGGTPNSLTIPGYGQGLTIENFSFGDSINVGGAALELVGTGPIYALETVGGGKTYGTVTLASGSTLTGSSPYPLTSSGGGDNTFPCFYAGTMLATADGEIAVEDVTIGTLLKTASGEFLPVRWVGWSQVAMRFADPLRILPIRIQAGALADDVPARDLLVSPDHAIFVDGLLVQALALVNGTSITREEDVPESFRYYHVEFATHELLLAEGCPAESFVDNIDRMNFHNWDAREAPAESVVEMEYPRAKSSRQVPVSIRSAIAARAARLVVACAA